MAVFADGRVVVLYSNGHVDDTFLKDGNVRLMEYGQSPHMYVTNMGSIRQQFRNNSYKIWHRIDVEPKVELLRSLTGESLGAGVWAPTVRSESMQSDGDLGDTEASSTIKAELANGVVVELLGYSSWGDDYRLTWHGFDGKVTEVDDVHEADVDGLGTAIACRIVSPDPNDQLKVHVTTTFSTHQKGIKGWDLGKDTYVLALPDKRRFVNLQFRITRVGQERKTSVIPVDPVELFISDEENGRVVVGQYGIGSIEGTLQEREPSGKTDEHPDRKRRLFELRLFPDEGTEVLRFDIQDRAGNCAKPCTVPRTDSRSMTRATYRMIPDDVAGVEARVRLNHKASVYVRNLCLIPGRASEVEVVVPGKTSEK